MRKICAWCKKDMEAVPTVNNLNYNISHGICEECIERIFAQQEAGLTPFFDDPGVATGVVNAERETL